MFPLVRHVAVEVASDDAVPRGVVLLVELFLDVGSDVLLDVVLLQRLLRAVYHVLLHLLRHVGVLDHRFPSRHLGGCNSKKSLYISVYYEELKCTRTYRPFEGFRENHKKLQSTLCASFMFVTTGKVADMFVTLRMFCINQ